MKKLLLLAVCAVIVSSGFGFKMEFDIVGEKKYKAAELTPIIYQNSRYDLGDLRIYDEDGNETPYFLYGADEPDYHTTAAHELELIAEFAEYNDWNMDFKIKEVKESSDVLISGLMLYIPSVNFAKQVVVYGSRDGLNWTEAARGTLYSVASGTNHSITFDYNVKYTYFRVKILNNVEKLRISGGEAVLSGLVEAEGLIKTLKVEYITEQREKETSLYIPDAKNLRLKSVTIQTNTIFERYVTADKPYLLYNLVFSDVSLKNTSIDFNGRSYKDLELTINNGDDKPIDIDGIELAYYAERLVFAPEQGKKYYLYFGRDDYNAPQYDMESYKTYIINDGFDECSFSALEELEQPETPQQRDYGWVLNVVVIITGVLIAAYILVHIKRR